MDHAFFYVICMILRTRICIYIYSKIFWDIFDELCWSCCCNAVYKLTPLTLNIYKYKDEILGHKEKKRQSCNTEDKICNYRMDLFCIKNIIFRIDVVVAFLEQ